MLLLKKMNKFVVIFSLIFLLSTTATAYAAKPTPTPTIPPTSLAKVCIDAGHGGTDTGAAYKGITEAQETLDIAQRLNTLLINNGSQTVMTRTNMSTTLGNTDRANICNNAGATLLISIHLNGSTNHATDYTQVLYGKQTKDKAWAQYLDGDLANLSSATGIGTIQNNGITNFADGVLLKANMPSALAETVFISSDLENALLQNGTGNRQQEIAQRLYNAISGWLLTH